MNKTKILINVATGINDTFGAVAHSINSAIKNKLNISDIFLTHDFYDNLNNFLNFKEINYISHISKEEKLNYEIHTSPRQRSTNLNINTKNHLSNYITLNDMMLQKIKNFNPDVGVHFRFKSHEVDNQKHIIRDIDRYIKGFNTIYDSTKTYYVCSSSPLLNDYFKQYDNIIFFPKQYVASKRINRKDNTEDVFTDLAYLSKCPIIFRTEGLFTESAKMLGKGIPEIKRLIDGLD